MAQGKLKAKAQLPKDVKNKKSAKKGSAITKRANRPIQPKKKGIVEAKKLKQIVHKNVNKAIEEELRSRATSDNKSLSAAQKAVAEYHKKGASGPS
ncbi:hypothetical protein TcasGA2_TC011509 [Tribolium castaneum]|uniref:Uncharacterized protein n=1 Tax=Tribolium castaneum TaxID=7070 RepID=D6W6F6_TRICA|nr:PREDICTED: uncharacterized protein LOC660080 [Tribolium castaneum]EFA11353.1 hypothetical protein TcasGA2_TC011509 [Tribolium castaneum]|eukprot:XP_971435.1 PREDICTED: uncharacterized protein LOC660080 [Tribolium castaneum]